MLILGNFIEASNFPMCAQQEKYFLNTHNIKQIFFRVDKGRFYIYVQCCEVKGSHLVHWGKGGDKEGSVALEELIHAINRGRRI